MNRAPKFLIGAVLIALCGGAAFAETEFKVRPIGDWGAIENAWQHSAELSSQEVAHWASTDALAGRKSVLGVSHCGRYGVLFGLETDAEFNGPKNPEGEQATSDARIVYGNVVPSETTPYPLLLRAGNIEYFFFDADTMIPASKFLICPTEESGPRCLTFSLRGIAAALKMVCPKR